MKVDIIIPNYNGSALIKKNLPGILTEIEKYKGTVIIVDDFSTNEEFQSLKDYIESLLIQGKQIKLFRNENNYGFSSTVNKGVRESNAEYVVLLNTDVLPDKGFLDEPIADLILDSNLFGVGMMDRSMEGGKTILRGRGVAFWKKGLLIHARGEVDHRDTFWVGGGSSVLRREIFEKLGGFDTLFNPFYWDDIDLSYRARKSGYDLMFEKKSIVTHQHEEGAIKTHYSAFSIKTIAYRNQILFVWKNITDMSFLLSHLFWLPYHLFIAGLRFDISFFLGFIYALARLPKVLHNRNVQVGLYKKRDFDLFNT